MNCTPTNRGVLAAMKSLGAVLFTGLTKMRNSITGSGTTIDWMVVSAKQAWDNGICKSYRWAIIIKKPAGKWRNWTSMAKKAVASTLGIAHGNKHQASRASVGLNLPVDHNMLRRRLA